MVMGHSNNLELVVFIVTTFRKEHRGSLPIRYIRDLKMQQKPGTDSWSYLSDSRNRHTKTTHKA